MSNSKAAVRKILDLVKADKRTSLTAPEGKLVCDAYGIPVPKEGVAKSASEAAKLATSIGFPVVLKIVSPEILHKTEAGGVLVGVKNAAEARRGLDTILANAKRRNRRRRTHRCRLRAGRRSLPAQPRRNRARHEPHHEARRRRCHRRLIRGRQDRQFRDEKSHQRWLSGRDLSYPPQCDRDPG